MLNVNSDTEYELRYNYLAQPETNGVKYIKIKPHWYQSIIIYSIFFLSLTTFGFYIITWKFRKKIKSSEAQQNKLEEEAMRLQSMLNPHFTFNALNSIQGLMNTGRTGEANTYLEEFGMLLRKSLSKNKDLFNSLDQELDMMRIYLRIEALRFDFQWEIIVSDVLHIAEIEIPTMLLQPLVENAVKHGVSSLKEQGQLIITCREEKNDLIIMIEDNGAWNSKTFVTGYGLALTHERIHTINTMQKDEQIFLSIDMDKDTGTQVILTFRNWLDI
jgi:LytS/YehU family sensor histidine kinase